MPSQLLHPVAHPFINMKRSHGTAQADLIQPDNHFPLPAALHPDPHPVHVRPVFPLHESPLIGKIDLLPARIVQTVFKLQCRFPVSSEGKNETCLRRSFTVYKTVESERMLQDAFFFPENLIGHDLLPLPVQDRPVRFQKAPLPSAPFQGRIRNITFPRLLQSSIRYPQILPCDSVVLFHTLLFLPLQAASGTEVCSMPSFAAAAPIPICF